MKRIEAGIWAYETGAGERRYQVRYRDGVRQRGRSFSRLQDARAFRAEVALARQQRRELRAPRLLRTLGQYAEEIWMPEAQWAPATRKRNQSVWERWIRPAPLTDLPIAAIDAEDILDWQQWARDRGVGAATLRLARIILSGAFTHAAARPRSSGVRSNPVSAARIGLPRRRRLRIVAAYPPAVWEALRRQLSQRDALIVSLMAYAGLRPSEALALRCGDIRERTLIVTGGKTGGRTVPLLAPLADDLAAWSRRDPHEPLIPRARGGPWDDTAYRNWRARIWRPATKRVPELAGERPYAARHSFASLMIRGGWGNNPTGLARIMGHSVAILLSTYAQVLDEFTGAEPIDPVAEIYAARVQVFGSREAAARALAAPEAPSALDAPTDLPPPAPDALPSPGMPSLSAPRSS